MPFENKIESKCNFQKPYTFFYTHAYIFLLTRKF